MVGPKQLEWFLLQYCPDAIKKKSVNLGILLVEIEAGGFAGARFTRDWDRVRRFDPEADIEMLKALEGDIRARLAESANCEEFLRQAKESFSTSIRLSPNHRCQASDPAQELERLAEMYLESRGPRGGRP